jgi:hypothetical protein
MAVIWGFALWRAEHERPPWAQAIRGAAGMDIGEVAGDRDRCQADREVTDKVNVITSLFEFVLPSLKDSLGNGCLEMIMTYRMVYAAAARETVR